MTFLNGALGEPSSSQIKVASQPTKGLPPAEADYIDGRYDNNPFTVTPAYVDRAAIQSGGVRAKDLIGKLNLAGEELDFGDLDPSSRVQQRMFANTFRKYTRTDNDPWWRWNYARDGATNADPYLAYLSDNDANPRMRAFDVQHGGFTLSAAPNGNLRLTSPWAGVYFDHFGAPVQTAGTGSPPYTSTTPFIRGFWDQNYAADATDKDIFVEFQTDLGSGQWTVRTKVSAAASFSNSQTLTEGFWLRLQDEAGAVIGIPGEQAELFLSATNTVAAGDIFRFDKNRDVWSQSLAASHPIAVVQGLAQINGVDIPIEGGLTLTAAYETFEPRPDIFRRQGGRVKRSGDLMVEVSINRELVDLALQKPLMTGETVSLALDFKTSETITTNKHYRALFLMPEMTVRGTTPGVPQGGADYDEQLVLRASSDTGTTMAYDGITATTHLSVILENGNTAQ